MMDTTDVDDFRGEHENEREWQLKRQFLLAHWEKFEPTRLQCLANCYLNVEMYGCRYPESVMQLLQDLTQEMGSEASLGRSAQSYQERSKVKFVKASMPNSPVKEDMKPDTRELVPPRRNYSHVKSSGTASKKISFVKSSESYESTDMASKDGAAARPGFGTGGSQLQKLVSPEVHTPTDMMSQMSVFSAGLQKVMEKSKEKHEQTREGIHTGGGDTAKNPPKKEQVLAPVPARSRTATAREEKFYHLAAVLTDLKWQKNNRNRSAVELLHMTGDKLQMTVTPIYRPSPHVSHNFTCQVQVDFITVGTGEASSKKQAKVVAYQDAVESLQKPCLQIKRLNPDMPEQLVASSEPDSDVAPTPSVHAPGPASVSNLGTNLMKLGEATQSNVHALAKMPVHKKHIDHGLRVAMENFLIIEPFHKTQSINAMSILRSSADFNKSNLEFEFVDEYDGHTAQVHCRISIGPMLIADAADQTRLSAKAAASELALEKLRRVCWTIQTKKHEDTDESGISRDTMMGDFQDHVNKTIPDSNIGSKLLKKMGWQGGGIGAEGNKGRAEPVSVGGVINRQGLGLTAEQGIGRSFLPTVRQMLQDYAGSHNEQDIAFSPDFRKEERAIIHREAQKLGLKSHSHGTGADRYLVISRKRNAAQLFSHIMASGGETSKYALIPPQE